MKQIFALAIMAAVSFAEEESEDAGEDASTWNNKCYHCINEGNMFCVDATPDANNAGQFVWNMDKGICMDATCEEQTAEEKENKATCKLSNRATCEV